LIIGRPDQKGSTERDKRMFVEGVLWIVRKGSWAAQGIRGQ
jgi:putative transposase